MTRTEQPDDEFYALKRERRRVYQHQAEEAQSLEAKRQTLVRAMKDDAPQTLHEKIVQMNRVGRDVGAQQ